MHRRDALIGLAGLAACAPLGQRAESAPHAAELAAIEARGGGTLGAAIVDLASGRAYGHRIDEPMPLQSVFKAFLAAQVLAEVDAGRMRLDEEIVLRRADLSIPWSPIGEAFTGEQQGFTLRALIESAVAQSDNTAADVLMRRMGGPAALTAWLRARGIEGIRIDRYEYDLQTQFSGLPAFNASMSNAAGLSAALALLTAETRAHALQAYLRDPRDTAAPRGAADFLVKLERGELISPASTRVLRDIMLATRTGPNRLTAGLPPGARLAHKTGSSASFGGVNGASNDIGLIYLADGRKLAVAVFLKGSTADEATRDRAIADVARLAWL